MLDWDIFLERGKGEEGVEVGSLGRGEVPVFPGFPIADHFVFPKGSFFIFFLCWKLDS